MKKKSSETILFIGGLIVLLVLINLLSLKGFLRLDLTRDQKYTLADASRQTVSRLEDTLTVSAYFTEDLPPPYAQHARYVKDLLAEYLAVSSGRFAYEFSDPVANETEEDRAKKKEMKRDIFGRLVREPTSVEAELIELGLKPVEIRVIEDDEQKTKRAYMGIVLRYQDKTEVIPVVTNLADLEKDMTSLMRKMVRVREPKLGIIKDVAGPNINKITELFAQNVEVSPVDLKIEEEISDDYDAIMIVGSGDHFDDKSAQKIDRFLKKGKSATFLLDRYQIDPATFQKTSLSPNSSTRNIFNLLSKYGVDIEDGLVADASCASLNMQENRSGFTFSVPVKYPFVPELTSLSFDNPMTKGLSGVILPFVSRLKIRDDAKDAFDVLASSSRVSWLETDPVDINPRRDWGSEDISPDGPFPLLMSKRGILPDLGLGAEPSKTANDTPLESRIVVMATSAFMWDEFISPANQILALNMVDWMLADSALLEMRSREFSDSPLDSEISDQKRRAIKYGNIIGVPMLLALYGIWRWRRRESRRRQLQNRK